MTEFVVGGRYRSIGPMGDPKNGYAEITVTGRDGDFWKIEGKGLPAKVVKVGCEDNYVAMYDCDKLGHFWVEGSPFCSVCNVKYQEDFGE